MRIAVITPSYRTPSSWLEMCFRSVQGQTVACSHFVVNDGDDAEAFANVREAHMVQIPGPHGDTGNAARAVGPICAIAGGFDAIAYLDADNWYEPHHIESLVE